MGRVREQSSVLGPGGPECGDGGGGGGDYGIVRGRRSNPGRVSKEKRWGCERSVRCHR